MLYSYCGTVRISPLHVAAIAAYLSLTVAMNLSSSIYGHALPHHRRFLFACAPSQGPEFYNNMEASNNAFGAEDSKAWM